MQAESIGDLSLVKSVVHSNTSTDRAGGIYGQIQPIGETAIISNTAVRYGGGIVSIMI